MNSYHTRLDDDAIQLAAQRLSPGPWSDSPWDLRGRRVGGAMLSALLRELRVRTPMNAVGVAFEEARDASPTTSAAWHEAWCRATVVWCVRELAAAAHASTDESSRGALIQLASQLAAAGARLREADAESSCAFEALVDEAREAFADARDGAAGGDAERAVLGVMLQQIRHTASLLVVGGHSVDSHLRGAVTRTDRAARRESMAMWSDAPLARRRALAQRGLMEAAWALAAHIPTLSARGPAGRDQALWFARTASQLASRIERVADWVPSVPEDLSRRLAPRDALLPARDVVPATPAPSRETTTPPPMERAMEPNKITPVLKTLENDAGDAAWRLAGSQFVKLAKDPLVALLSRQLSPDDESFRARLATFLDTEVGSAILASLLSVGLSALPLPNTDVTQRLSRELRVRAMAGAGDVLADVLMGPLRQVAVMYLQGVPGAGAEKVSDPAALPAAQVIDALRSAAAVSEATPTEPVTT